MGQGVPRSSYDAGSHRPPRPSRHHLRNECRELSTPRRTRPQAWPRPAPDARDNQGKSLIDAARQSKSSVDKKMLAKLRTQDDHTFATGRRLHTLIAAAVLIQIVARQSRFTCAWHWSRATNIRRE